MTKKKLLVGISILLTFLNVFISHVYCLKGGKNQLKNYVDPKSYPYCEKNYTYRNKKTFGVKTNDLYRYLEDLNNTKTKTFMIQLNLIFNNFMDNSKYTNEIRSKFLGYNKYLEHDLLMEVGDYYYYYSRNSLHFQSILKRMNKNIKNVTEFINLDMIDVRKQSEIKSMAISQKKDILAYEVVGRFEYSQIKFKYTNGQDMNDTLTINSITEYAFVLEDQGIIYSRYPHYTLLDGIVYPERKEHALYYHKFGTSQERDVLIYDVGDKPELEITAKLANSQKYLFVKIYNTKTDYSELYYYNLEKVNDFNGKIKLQRLISGFDAYYEIYDSFSKYVIIYSNSKSINGIARVEIPEEPNSKVKIHKFVEERENVHIKNIIPVGEKYIVLNCYENPDSFLEIYDKHRSRFITRLEVGKGIIVNGQGSIDSYHFYYSFNSVFIPSAIYKIDLSFINVSDTSNLKPVKLFQSEIQNVNPDDFVLKTVFFKSKDRKTIPMLMIYKKTMKKNKKNPVIVEAYGDLSASWHPQNSLIKLVFIKHFDGIWCIPGIRGGRYFSKKWHLDGIQRKRKNSFNDFIWGIKHLIKYGYTNPKKIAIYGYNEGGLLTAYVSQKKPKLIGAVVSKSPLLDAIRFDKIAPRGKQLKNIYGDPKNRKDFKFLYSISPYHQLKIKKYSARQWPSTLIMSTYGFEVYGVQHTTKYLAKLYQLFRENRKFGQTNPVLGNIIYIAAPDDRELTGDQIMDEHFRMINFLTQTLDLKWKN
uniref:Prolyl endopeptidase n=2 Tax=Strongyloides stercoralis TaxID=6248 RepID=A0A0K0EB36_STRER